MLKERSSKISAGRGPKNETLDLYRTFCRELYGLIGNQKYKHFHGVDSKPKSGGLVEQTGHLSGLKGEGGFAELRLAASNKFGFLFIIVKFT